MSCNCNNIDPCSNTAVSCLCGLEFNIYDSSGVLIETVNAYQDAFESEPTYIISGSTAFESVLGQPYTLYIYYNTDLNRWEMAYGNETISSFVVIGVFYGSANSCPASNCWDMDCIAVAFNVVGTYDSFFIWDGTYINGKKSYTFTSDWSGSDINYSIAWGLAPAESLAPEGTLCWILTDEDSGNPGGYLFGLNDCPYGTYISNWNGDATRFSFDDLGVTGYDVKSSILDCGCCDEKVSVTTYDGETFNVYELSVNYDEYGNVLVLNGYNYYSYVNEETEYYLYVNSQGNWVLNTLFNNPETEIAYTPVSSDCPFGSYNINPAPEPCGCDTIIVTYQLIGEEPVTVEVGISNFEPIVNGKNRYDFNVVEGINGALVWSLDLSVGASWIYSDGDNIAILTEDTPCPFGTFTIEEGSIFESFEVTSVCSCDCIKVSFTYDGVDYEYNIDKNGETNGKNTFEFIGGGLEIAVNWQDFYSDPDYSWTIGYSNAALGIDFIAYNTTDTQCPSFNEWIYYTETEVENLVITECSVPTNILVTVKGVDCFDCCDYYRPGNRNLLKKKKAIFVDEISSIRNKEIFGFKCGTSWDDLFRKHLIFDVLNCLPYGVICDEEEQCLINNLNENCNC